MFRMLNLHALATRRDDGLRSAFLDAEAKRQALGATNVENLLDHFSHRFQQAGPNPATKPCALADWAGAGKVALFCKAQQTDRKPK